MSLDLRLAQIDDLASILQLERTCKDAPHWSEDAWRNVLQQDPQSLLQRVCFLATESELQGCIVVSCVDALGELESVVVHPRARRQGIGRALCLEAIAWFAKLHAVSVQLEVRSKNVGALALYRSLGFVKDGGRAAYYRNPVEDAVLLRLKIDAGPAKV